MANFPTKTLSDFKSKLKGGGARPNLFEVSIPAFPSGASSFWSGGGDDSENPTSNSNENFRFLCKAAQLPASTVASVPVAFRGRELKVAGERTFDPWTVTIINDEDFSLRTSFEGWMNKLSKLDDATGISNPSSYMQNAYVHQLGRSATQASLINDGGKSVRLRTYKFYDIFPTNVSAIELSYDTTNTVEEFTVEFQVQYFSIGETEEVAESTTADDSDTGGSVIR
tara:strand:+ start:228 stop:905 length:678 start_codon:yes stop_codon:yes gene_type:complete